MRAAVGRSGGGGGGGPAWSNQIPKGRGAVRDGREQQLKHRLTALYTSPDALFGERAERARVRVVADHAARAARARAAVEAGIADALAALRGRHRVVGCYDQLLRRVARGDRVCRRRRRADADGVEKMADGGRERAAAGGVAPTRALSSRRWKLCHEFNSTSCGCACISHARGRQTTCARLTETLESPL